MPKPSGQRLAAAYENARKSTLKTEHRRLSAKEFLDAVDPQGKRSAKSARDYLRRIVKGERSGAKITQRADKGGGQYIVVYRRGKDEASAIVRVPTGKSNLGIFQRASKREIKQAANEYVATRQAQGWYKDKAGTGPVSYENWTQVGIRPLAQTRYKAAIVNPRGRR